MPGWRYAFALSRKAVKTASPPGTVVLIEHTPVRGNRNGNSNDNSHFVEQVIKVPTPTADPADPLNWPTWRKAACMITVAWYAFVCNYISASIAPALPLWNHAFPGDRRKEEELMRFVAFNVLVLGLGNIIWVPLANIYGRRLILVLSTIMLSGATMLGVFRTGYTTTLLIRILQGLGSSASETVTPAIVGDLFFVHERGGWMAFYSASLATGSVIGGITGGYIAAELGWVRQFYVGMVMSGIASLAVMFLVPETMFDRAKFTLPTEMQFPRVTRYFGPVDGVGGSSGSSNGRRAGVSTNGEGTKQTAREGVQVVTQDDATPAALEGRGSSRRDRRNGGARNSGLQRNGHLSNSSRNSGLRNSGVRVWSSAPRQSLMTLPSIAHSQFTRRMTNGSLLPEEMQTWYEEATDDGQEQGQELEQNEEDFEEDEEVARASIRGVAGSEVDGDEGREEETGNGTGSRSARRNGILIENTDIPRAYLHRNGNGSSGRNNHGNHRQFATDYEASAAGPSNYYKGPSNSLENTGIPQAYPHRNGNGNGNRRQFATDHGTTAAGPSNHYEGPNNDTSSRGQANGQHHNFSRPGPYRETQPPLARSTSPNVRASWRFTNPRRAPKPPSSPPPPVPPLPPVEPATGPGPRGATSTISTTYPPFSFLRSLRFSPNRGHALHHFCKPWSALRLPATWIIMFQYGGLVGSVAVISTVGPQVLSRPPYRWGEHAGLLFVGALVGIVLGGLWTGLVADWMVKWRARSQESGFAEPEARVGVVVPALVVATCGLLVFGACAQSPGDNALGWVGLEAAFGMVSFALAQVPSIWFGYLIDAYDQLASDCFVMICVFRGAIPFAWTLVAAQWIEKAGYLVPFGGFAGIMAVFSMLIIPVVCGGKRMRIATARFVVANQ